MVRKVKVEVGSGNIFADLGLPDADTHFLKAQIVSEIYRIAKERKLIRLKPASSWASPSLKCPVCSRVTFESIPSTV